MRSLKNRELVFTTSGRSVSTFTNTGGHNPQNQVGIIPFPFDDDFDEYTIVGTMLLRNDTATETTFARLYNYATASTVGTGGEVSVDGVAYTPVETGEVTLQADVADAYGPARLGFEGYVTGGQGLIDRTTVAVYGKR